MKKRIDDFKLKFDKSIKEVNTKEDLDKVRSNFVTSKESFLITAFSEVRKSSNDVKKEVGELINKTKKYFIEEINKLNDKFQKAEYDKLLKKEQWDVSIEGLQFQPGTSHPLNLVIDEIKQIFTELGYEMINGTEFETDDFCFQKLNLPIGHPARDMQDTFYVDESTVLRTHSTNMTARTLTELAKAKDSIPANVGMISYGNVYRRDDDDATHSHQFTQIDGLLMGENISFANLKWTLEYVCKRLFGEDTVIRMRPSFFPFTEPSAEVDINCVSCKGEGCRICKYSGWIEILGSGMIAKEVFELNGLDSNKYQAIAFGWGIERIAMLKFGVTNIRDFYENNNKFLKQFKFFGK